MAVIQLVLWAVVGVLLGIVLFTAAPITAAWIDGPDLQERVSSWYVWLAQTAASKSAMHIRPGKVELIYKKYDPDYNADRDSAAGDPQHHRDSLNVLSRLANKPFGLTLPDADEYVSPLLADVGAAARRAQEDERVGPTQREVAVTDGSGSKQHKTVRAFEDGILVPARSRLVDVRAARHVVSGSAEPTDGHESEVMTEISQEKFHQKVTFGQIIVFVGATLAMMALAWLLASQGGSAPEATQIPGMIGGWWL